MATLEALRALPGVDAAATAIFLPGVPAHYESTFELVEGRSDPEARIDRRKPRRVSGLFRDDGDPPDWRRAVRRPGPRRLQ